MLMLHNNSSSWMQNSLARTAALTISAAWLNKPPHFQWVHKVILFEWVMPDTYYQVYFSQNDNPTYSTLKQSFKKNKQKKQTWDIAENDFKPTTPALRGDVSLACYFYCGGAKWNRWLQHAQAELLWRQKSIQQYHSKTYRGFSSSQRSPRSNRI